MTLNSVLAHILRYFAEFDLTIFTNLIETYKILSGFEKASSHQFFQLQSSDYCTRGHSIKLKVQR